MSADSDTDSPLDTREPTRSEEDSRPALAARLKVESFAGPLPPPATLAAYNAIVPGAAERILKMAEAQAYYTVTSLKQSPYVRMRGKLCSASASALW